MKPRYDVIMQKDARIFRSLATSRLTVEPITTVDHAFVQALVNSAGWLENIGDRNVHSTDDAIRYITKLIATENLVYWVVRGKHTNTPMGIVSFLKRDYLDHFDIGFAFLPDFSGNGYAYEATNAVLQRLREHADFETILATIIPSNEKSGRLLTKLGFTFDKMVDEEDRVIHIYKNTNQA